MTGYPQKRGNHGRKIGVYADLPIKRHCACPDPVVYDDEDGDQCCFRCGRCLNPPVSRAA